MTIEITAFWVWLVLLFCLFAFEFLAVKLDDRAADKEKQKLVERGRENEQSDFAQQLRGEQ